MTDPLQFLDDLADSARNEKVPQGDVSENVARIIRETRPKPRKPVIFFAAIRMISAGLLRTWPRSTFVIRNSKRTNPAEFREGGQTKLK